MSLLVDGITPKLLKTTISILMLQIQNSIGKQVINSYLIILLHLKSYKKAYNYLTTCPVRTWKTPTSKAWKQLSQQTTRYRTTTTPLLVGLTLTFPIPPPTLANPLGPFWGTRYNWLKRRRRSERQMISLMRSGVY